MSALTFFREGDQVVVKTAKNQVPMTIRGIYFNQLNKKTEYKCSWKLFDGRISNTIYREDELELPSRI